jgi:hypothetical protein
MDEEVFVTISDIRLAGYCVQGMRSWAELNGVDFRQFMLDGQVSSSKLPADDAMVKHILKVKAISNGWR